MSQDSTINCHKSFRFVRKAHIPSLNLDLQEFEHIETGAQHVHLSAENEENVFLVALRTVPHDSSGVAHILEHTALCGSKRYPVRDPFFMMTRRSLNTFMNAFTSSDWTAYPFASLNKKDFNNLLDVYLDAVFFSRLDPLDFAQEGHRLEFEKAEDVSSALVYKGVVYNEMKGAMSSVPSQLWQSLSRYLFPTTTYHHNSGGDPASIPDLSYEELLHFYQTHYHPSNAIFMTYGDISAEDHQEKFHEQALKDFQRLDYTVAVADEKRYFSPLRVQESYPLSDGEAEDKTHVVMGWLLGKSTDLMSSLKSQLLSSVLLDNSATPLMHALETSELGNAPSPLCGLDDSQKELTFMCGLEGCKAGQADEVESLILHTIEQVAKEGIPQEDIASALHQLELNQREVGGDSYPYGLQIILTALTATTYRGDPVGLLNIDNALQQLREDIKDPAFIKNLATQMLLENMHRVRLELRPDTALNVRKDAAEKAQLAAIKDALSDAEKQAIVTLASDLKARQEQVDDESILPKVSLDDVPQAEVHLTGEKPSEKDFALTRYPAGTNGLVYQQLVFPFPQVKLEQLAILPLYSNCLTELGVGEKDYLSVQRWQAQVCGSLNTFSSIRGATNDIHRVNGYFVHSGKALNRNQAKLTELMHATVENVRFDEHSRIAELVAQIRAQREQSVTGNGHALAMTAASAGMCENARLSHEVSGLAGIRALKQRHKSIQSDSKNLEALAASMAALHKSIHEHDPQLLLIAEEAQLEPFTQTLKTHISNTAWPSSASPLLSESHTRKVQEAWLTNSQVNFCAKAYATVPMDHEDAAPLVVLGGFLRNGYLHKTIREQGGAYGGGASQDNGLGAFRFYSYRDPRLSDTLQDFDASIQWLLNNSHEWSKIEEAILGVISSLDKSESPAGRAKRCFHADLHGRTMEGRQRFRERVLSVREEDLKRVGERYLKPEQAHVAVISDFGQADLVKDLGLQVHEL